MLTDPPPTSTPAVVPSRRERWVAWRARRPVAGGVLLIVATVFLALPALATIRLGDVLITITTIAGVSTVLLAALMAVCAAAALSGGGARVPAGVGAMVIALVALPASNFGGYLLGTAAGILGAAATLAWRRDDHGHSNDTVPVQKGSTTNEQC